MRDLIGPRFRYPADLRPEQLDAINFAVEHPSALVVGGVGSGKTAIGLSVHLLTKSRRTLVVGTPLIAAVVWDREATRWTHTADLQFSKVSGTPRQRTKALAAEADIYMATYTTLHWLAEQGHLADFDLVIWDEVSQLRNISTRKFRKVRKWIPKIPRRLGLTASVSPNDLENIFGVRYVCDGGEGWGRAFTTWRAKWFDSDYLGYDWTPKPGAFQALMAQMSPMTYVVEGEDDRPPLVVEDVVVPMGRAVAEWYDAITKDNVLRFDDVEIVAESAALVRQKQQQLAQGFIYDADGRDYRIDGFKAGEIIACVTTRCKGPTVIGWTYKADLTFLKEAFPHARELSADVVDDWNAGRVPILLVNPQSGAHGLNLQFGGSTIIFYGLNWSLELYEQLIGRLWRSGQPADQVTVYRLISRGTVDEEMVESLAVKDQRQERVKKALA